MSHPKQSRLEFRPGFRQQTECSYWDYYVDDKRLADIFDIGDFIPPFGWLTAESETLFAEMLLRKRESDLRPDRIPLFVCPLCVSYSCGVFTCSVTRVDDSIQWRNFGFEMDYDEELHQGDAEKYSWYAFDASEYYHAFDRFRTEQYRRRK